MLSIVWKCDFYKLGKINLDDFLCKFSSDIYITWTLIGVALLFGLFTFGGDLCFESKGPFLTFDFDLFNLLLTNISLPGDSSCLPLLLRLPLFLSI